MPELPEVEVTRRGLLAQICGHRIQGVWTSGKALRHLSPITLLQTGLIGQRIEAIDRRAKYLLLRVEHGAVLCLHLGMSGKLSVLAAKQTRHKHDHLGLTLEHGFELRLNDSRRFGVARLWLGQDAPACEARFSQGEGIEPLGPDFQAARLACLARRRRVAVKSLLMNSRLIAGIGNIYANEILFAAGVHPHSQAANLSLDDWERIRAATITILERAIAAGGSTIADFLGADGHPGYFQLQLQVYHRNALPCHRCGQCIERSLIAGRATYFCPNCQPLVMHT